MLVFQKTVLSKFRLLVKGCRSLIPAKVTVKFTLYFLLCVQPHLHKIVNSSMELAQSAKEPYNYFLLLRALFRSIGGGSHDLLYQEFLPLLPNLLQGKQILLFDYV